MMVRDCALDSGSLTTDTEIVRMSHCGGFYFEDRYVKGCVQSCFEDACNHAIPSLMTRIFPGVSNLIPCCLELTTHLIMSTTYLRFMLTNL